MRVDVPIGLLAEPAFSTTTFPPFSTSAQAYPNRLPFRTSPQSPSVRSGLLFRCLLDSALPPAVKAESLHVRPAFSGLIPWIWAIRYC